MNAEHKRIDIEALKRAVSLAEIAQQVLYPHPTDVAQFDNDYQDHRRFLHQKMNIPEDARPYTITRILPTPEGYAPFYQIFTMPFPSAEALQQTMSSPEMQEVAADAFRISSGGAPVILVGSEAS